MSDKPHYYAVRRGKNVRNCVFFNWRDAKEHVDHDHFPGATYRTFDNWKDAASFVNGGTCTQEGTDDNDHDGTCRNSLEERMDSSDGGDGHCGSTSFTLKEYGVEANEWIGNEEERTTSSSSGTAGMMPALPLPSSALDHPHTHRNMTMNRANETLPSTRRTEERDASNNINMDNSPLSSTTTSSTIKETNQVVTQTDPQTQPLATTAVPNEPPPRKRKRRKKLKREIYQVDGRLIQKRRPTDTWMKMLNELKGYREQKGSFTVDAKENIVLKRWVQQQHYEYKQSLQIGRKSHMSKAKIRLLSGIGFHFHAWEAQLDQLKRFKEMTGNIDVPEFNDLSKWVEVQRRQLFLVSKGEESKLTKEQIQQLKDVGLDLEDTAVYKRLRLKAESNAMAKRWEDMFEKLKAYQDDHGDCHVPTEDKEMYAWIAAQRVEYRKVKKGELSRLTAPRIQRLNDIGLDFNPRSKYHTFEDRLKQLQQFKEQHGHLRVPVSHPELGTFVARQRVDYGRFMAGKATLGISAERVEKLSKLGFVFSVMKRKSPAIERPQRKKWEERFQELLQFKEENGHTLVTQSSGLGEWVHKQRTQYKLLKAGKKTALTTEKALQLADIGFVFDASGYRRKIPNEQVPMPLPIQVQQLQNQDAYQLVNVRTPLL